MRGAASREQRFLQRVNDQQEYGKDDHAGERDVLHGCSACSSRHVLPGLIAPHVPAPGSCLSLKFESAFYGDKRQCHCAQLFGGPAGRLWVLRRR